MSLRVQPSCDTNDSREEGRHGLGQQDAGASNARSAPAPRAGQRLYVRSLKGSTYATCKITVTTDEHDTITGSSLIGDRKSCNVYDDRLGE
jgi:hypothetical protein